MVGALPVELLREIFTKSLPSREEANEMGRVSLLDSPWSLTHVSRLWRAVALDIHSLWASITIAIANVTPSWLNYPLRLVEEQLSRSGNHPLQVIFLSQEMPGYTTVKLFDVIAPSSNRWETLELDSLGYLGSDTFRSAPLLQVVRIVHDTSAASWMTKKHTMLPWAQLTTFESTYHERRQSEGILLAQNLVECQLAVPFHDLLGIPRGRLQFSPQSFHS
ncbi:hypothetical protein B0H19DRAFT_1173726 [Mycena capillaripes]|nr:hypothetical protein B0H19DRAFT_1173726 [Mycena capillaripes]